MFLFIKPHPSLTTFYKHQVHFKMPSRYRPHFVVNDSESFYLSFKSDTHF